MTTTQKRTTLTDGIPVEPPDPLFAQLRDALKPAYQLLRRLGEGGMGAVFLAREPSLKRDVAVKVMLPWLAKDPTARLRFEREAQAVAAITHPNVINVYGTGELPDGTPYFIMQFVPGRSLSDRLGAEGPFGVREARRVLAEVAAGLAAAHHRGIIHRDIKASNILQDSETGRVIVTDFGIAAVRAGAAGDRATSKSRLTQPDVGSPGTVDFMAPEQLLGEEPTEASDVYSFGLLAYELLTGAGPFRATSPHEMAAAHLRDQPKRLSQHRDDVDSELDHLVSACLAKQPSDRPTAAGLVQHLPPGDVLALEWPPPGLESLAGRLPRMTRRLGLGSTLVAAALLGIILADPDLGPVLPFWILGLAAGTGAVLLLSGVAAASRVLRQGRRAQRRGYGWLPLMEVVADNRGDSGALITGLREYAALPRAVRNRLRAWRMVAAACAFGAALAPLLTLALVVRLASGGTLAPSTTAVLVVLPSLLLLSVATGLRARENRLARGRATRRPTRNTKTAETAQPVVDAWNESFDRARTGQPLGDRAPSPAFIRAVMAILLVLVLVAAVALAPLVFLPALGTVVATTTVPKFSSTRGRVLRAEAGRPWATPHDRTISPFAAGEAFHAILLAGRDRYEPQFRAPARRLESFMPAGPNPLESVMYGPPATLDSLFRLAARRAFTAEQRGFLERAAAINGWETFRTAARAPRADLVAARYQPDSLAVMTWLSVPLGRYVDARVPLHAATAVAALRVSQGRFAEAETVLRDAIGYGLNVMDNGTTMLETLVGTNIASQAFDRLEVLYDNTGRTSEAARLRAARDQARSKQDELAQLEDARFAMAARSPMGLLRRATQELMGDTTMPRSFRWEFVRLATDLPCFNARELVFGPSADLDSGLTRFRRQVVQLPGDSAWLAISTGRDWTAPTASRRLVADAFGVALGNPRLRRCLSLALSLDAF